MIVIIEDIYEQILRHSGTKDSYISQDRLKTTLNAFTFNYVDINDKRCIHDNKSLKVLWELREKFVILKADKGQGIVLVNYGDYVNSVQRTVDDASKLQKIKKDPTITRFFVRRHYVKKAKLLNLKRK